MLIFCKFMGLNSNISPTEFVIKLFSLNKNKQICVFSINQYYLF